MITPWVENGAIIQCQNDIAVKGIQKNCMQRHQGFRALLSKVWRYVPATGTAAASLTLLAQHDVTRFGDYFTSTVGTLTKDEESSGVIDITSLLGRGDGKKYFFLTTQNHAADTSANSAELVEGGQLMRMSL